MMMIQLVL